MRSYIGIKMYRAASSWNKTSVNLEESSVQMASFTVYVLYVLLHHCFKVCWQWKRFWEEEDIWDIKTGSRALKLSENITVIVWASFRAPGVSLSSPLLLNASGVIPKRPPAQRTSLKYWCVWNLHRVFVHWTNHKLTRYSSPVHTPATPLTVTQPT